MRQGSFVRKGATVVADMGTRPGLHGQTLLSSGHPDLDRLLGGGLPLGSLLLVLEDGWSGHHTTLLRYFLAEGAASGQSILLAAAPPPPGGLGKFLPAQLKGKAAEKDEEEGGKERDEFTLRIAWQYRRYLKPGGSSTSIGLAGTPASVTSRTSSSSSSGAASPSTGHASGGGKKSAGSRDWCHRFDLLKAAGDEGLQQCRAQLVDCSANPSGGSQYDSPASSTQRLLAAAAEFAQQLAPLQQQPSTAPGASAAAARPGTGAQQGGPQSVGRIAVLSLGSLGWQLADSAQPESSSSCAGHPAGASSQQPASSGAAGWLSSEVVRALLRLKGLTRQRRCAVVVTVPGALLSASDMARLQHLADGVIALESVADDSDIARLAPDPASVAGLLHLRKLPALGTSVPALPEAALHLIRHKRRRVAITPVEIDPDAESAEAGAAGGAGKSAAAALCGGPPKANKALDF